MVKLKEGTETGRVSDGIEDRLRCQPKRGAFDIHGGTMHHSKKLIPVLIAAAALTVSADEKKITNEEVPAAVQDSFSKSFPNAHIKRYTSDQENGKPVFEVDSIRDKKTLDVSFTTMGDILKSEEGIDTGELPPAVTNAVHRMFPQATVKRAEKMTRGSNSFFEVALRNAPKKEVLFAPDGKLAK